MELDGEADLRDLVAAGQRITFAKACLRHLPNAALGTAHAFQRHALALRLVGHQPKQRDLHGLDVVLDVVGEIEGLQQVVQ